MRELKLSIIACLTYINIFAQEKQPAKHQMPEYYKKEEIIFDGKRYRIHNSYLSLGGGFLQSTIRPKLQKTLGVDFQFPIRKLHFQAGVMMSGEEFASNNNVQGHVCYGLRKEQLRSNLAMFAGPSFYTGVEGDASGNPRFYQGVGLYLCGQAITKFAYDIGVGAEIFAEVSFKQTMVGLKIITFFSGAYRGLKKNVNPNVRSESSR